MGMNFEIDPAQLTIDDFLANMFLQGPVKLVLDQMSVQWRAYQIRPTART